MGCQCNCPEDQLTIDPNALQFFLNNPSLLNGDIASNTIYGNSLPKFPRTSIPLNYDNNFNHRNGLTLPTLTSQQEPANKIESSKSVPNLHKQNSNGAEPEAAQFPKEVLLENGGQLPVDDRDGWCRNKKYIKKILTGYQCTICKKTYGR